RRVPPADPKDHAAAERLAAARSLRLRRAPADSIGGWPAGAFRSAGEGGRRLRGSAVRTPGGSPVRLLAPLRTCRICRRALVTRAAWAAGGPQFLKNGLWLPNFSGVGRVSKPRSETHLLSQEVRCRRAS